MRRYGIPDSSLNERHGRKLSDSICEIEDVARDIALPSVWLQTRCEIAGYWASVKRDRDRALEECHALEQLVTKHDFPGYGMHGISRPKLHALLDSGIQSDRDEAIHLIRNNFLTLHLKDPHFYYEKLLTTWNCELGLSLEFPKAVYGSGILTYLSRN